MKKLRALERLKKAERNFVNTFNQGIAREVVNFCMRHKVGTVFMEDLSGFGKDRKNDFILRNWSYYELQKLIVEKAEREGIKVIADVNTAYTSQDCHCCGKRGVRLSQAEFMCTNELCDNFDKVINADYNGALNIVKSGLDLLS